ncbi:uncharacterized protein PAC_11061 [Phialocephala subalpina]|uniref:Uncharacterized protein n=1 Tax=Phialocephala subalpina TaxID=576137 RepID=A0A1L7X814_9HELO|nr:uncharacterized protein PAC_11061 [Phialocephala subalpina]
MAPNANEVNPQKCQRYARFLSGISHREANGIFWGCFVLVLFLLVVVGILYASSAKRHKSFQLAEHVSEWHPIESTEGDIEKVRSKHNKAESRLLWGSLACAIVMIPIVILIAFAGLAINFCHHEDLIFFFWGPFFLLSVGTLIATWGLFLSQSIENEPAWNVALGTPVLVFAAIGHWAHVFMRWTWRQIREKEDKEDAVSVAPRNMPPRYLPSCAYCQRVDPFALSMHNTRRMSQYPSQASAQEVTNLVPRQQPGTSRLTVASNVAEQGNSRSTTPEMTQVRIERPTSIS